jgi:hypothetical protein
MLGRVKGWLLAMLTLPLTQSMCGQLQSFLKQGCAWLRCRREERRF